MTLPLPTPQTALALGGAKEKLCGIIPVVPATDYGCNSESCHRFQEGYLLTRGQVKAFWQAKLSDPETEQHHHYVSPLRCVGRSRVACLSWKRQRRNPFGSVRLDSSILNPTPHHTTPRHPTARRPRRWGRCRPCCS